MGTFYINAQKIDKLLAKKKYDKAIEYSSKRKTKSEQNLCYKKVAEAYYKDAEKQGTTPLTEKHYEKAIKYYSKSNDKEGSKLANEKLGDIKFKNKKFDAAEYHYFQANNIKKIRLTAYEQGNIEFNKGKYLEAVESYKMAKRDDKLKLTYKKIADEAYQNKRFKKSIRYYEKANDTINIIKAYKNVANIYFDKANFLRATEYYKLANDTSNIKKSKKQLGLQYMNEKKYSDAINCFKEINDTKNLKAAYHKYARKQYSENNYYKAIKYFNLAKDKRGVYKTYLKMADIAYTRKNFKKALNYLNKCKKIYPNKPELLNKFEQYSNFITDARDGKTYTTVKIGNQWWMAENVSYYSRKLFREYDDENMPRSDPRTDSYEDIYGYLYSFYVAKKVCPTGWHLPSHEEWKELEIHLGMSASKAEGDGYLRGYEIVGKLLYKNYLWEKGYGSEKITNSTGFSALPSGHGWFKHKPDAGGGLNISYYSNVKKEAHFWSSTEYRPYDHSNYFQGITRVFRTKEIRIGKSSTHNSFNSVRCVKD